MSILIGDGCAIRVGAANSMASVFASNLDQVVIYSGTSLIRSPTGMSKSYVNGEVTLLQGDNLIFFALSNTIWDWARLTVMTR